MNFRAGRSTLPFVAMVCMIPAVAVGDYWYGDFTGDSTYTAEAAPLFSSQTDSSEVLMELPAGSLLRILGSGEGSYQRAGLSSYWYQVSLVEGDLTGWIPGAFLALSALPLGGDTLFIFAVTGWDDSLGEFESTARVLAAGEVLDEVIGNPPGSECGSEFYPYNTECYQLDATGLDGILNLINLSFIYSACGYQNPDLLFAWTGSELVVGPQGPNEYEAGIYVLHSRFGLPSNGGGAGVVTVETSLSQWDEALEDYVESETHNVTYRWEHGAFNRVQP